MYTWKDPEIYQIGTMNQTSQNDWPKETWKKCPIKVSQTVMRMRFSNSLSLSLAVHPSQVLSFFLLDQQLQINNPHTSLEGSQRYSAKINVNNELHEDLLIPFEENTLL